MKEKLKVDFINSMKYVLYPIVLFGASNIQDYFSLENKRVIWSFMVEFIVNITEILEKQVRANPCR